MKRMGKGTRVQIEERINEVYMLLLQKEPTQKIWAYATKKWGISNRQCDRYIASAHQRMIDDLKKDRHLLLAKAIAERNDLYRLARKEYKYFTCLQIADSRDKLLGLDFGLEDHIKGVLAAGFIIVEPGADATDESEIADAAVDAFFPDDPIANIESAHDTEDSI